MRRKNIEKLRLVHEPDMFASDQLRLERLDKKEDRWGLYRSSHGGPYYSFDSDLSCGCSGSVCGSGDSTLSATIEGILETLFGKPYRMRPYKRWDRFLFSLKEAISTVKNENNPIGSYSQGIQIEYNGREANDVVAILADSLLGRLHGRYSDYRSVKNYELEITEGGAEYSVVFEYGPRKIEIVYTLPKREYGGQISLYMQDSRY